MISAENISNILTQTIEDCDLIVINDVEFPIKKLLNTFPDSMLEKFVLYELSKPTIQKKFQEIIKGKKRLYTEDDEYNILLECKINFPKEIDPFGIEGKRYMEQILYRLINGRYQCPIAKPRTLLPTALGNRFISFDEMKQVLKYLCFKESELDLVEEIYKYSSDEDGERNINEHVFWDIDIGTSDDDDEELAMDVLNYIKSEIENEESDTDLKNDDYYFDDFTGFLE